MAPAPAAAREAVGRGRAGAAGEGAAGPSASPGAAGGVGRGRCVHSRWRSAEHTGQAACVCGWGAQQPGGGAPLCLRQSESGASAGARRRTHSRAARRARRAPDLEPVQGRCGLGSSSARTCGSTRLRIEWSEERWGVVSSVRTFRTGTCRSTVSTDGLGAPAPRAAPRAPPPTAAPRLFSLLHTATSAPPRPPQPHRASPPPCRLLCHLSSAIAIASMIAAASFPSPPLPPPPTLHPRRRRPRASPPPHPTRSRRRSPCPRCSHRRALGRMRSASAPSPREGAI